MRPGGDSAADPPDPESSVDSDSDSLLRAIAHLPSRPPPVDAELPTRIARFRVLEKIGAGGMGVVYRCEDEDLKRMVALKVLPPGFEVDADRRRRFLREARAASAVAHPNLAAVYEVGEADGQVFIAMELVEGRSLRQVLAAGRVPETEALRIAKDVARGVAKAHERGIVHRDLKPDNVMVAVDGGVKVLDFGLATLPRAEGSEAPSTLTVDGRIVGTPGYMSPEQAEGKTVDARTDVFALGAMLYELCTGTKPFKGDSSMQVLIATSRDEPTPPSKLDSRVTPVLEALIERCLAKQPGDRFANAEEVLVALETMPHRRARTGAAAWGAVAVLALAGGLATWRVVQPSTNPSTPPTSPSIVAATETALLPPTSAPTSATPAATQIVAPTMAPAVATTASASRRLGPRPPSSANAPPIASVSIVPRSSAATSAAVASPGGVIPESPY